MKRKIPVDTAQKYKIPTSLTDFQLSMYIHLIEWKWKYITTQPGKHGGRHYDAIIPKEFLEKGYPLYPPIIKEMEKHHFKKHKYFGHMASSQAACINLFTPILIQKDVAERILPKINRRFKSLATGYLEDGFQFEYWDESNPLNDHNDAAGTDSDIAIAYFDTNDELCLWLIEHKLTENEFTTCGGFRSKRNAKKELCKKGSSVLEDSMDCYYTYRCGYKYWEITNKSKLYNFSGHTGRCPFLGGENQLWRNQLLANAIQNKGVFKKVHFSVVHHPDNTDLQNTMNNYSHLLEDQSLFSSFPSREIITAAQLEDNEKIKIWAKWYSGLYRV